MNIKVWSIEISKRCEFCKGQGFTEMPDPNSFNVKEVTCRECKGKKKITERITLEQLKEIVGAA